MKQKTLSTLEVLIEVVVAVGLIFFVVFSFVKALEKNDKVICNKLVDQSISEVWYATANERAMCEDLGIQLPPDKVSVGTSFGGDSITVSGTGFTNQ